MTGFSGGIGGDDPAAGPRRTAFRAGVVGRSEPSGPSKGTVVLVHLYPREMSIYGDLGNTRVLQQRLIWHGYSCEVRPHHPGAPFPRDAHLVVGGGGQDSGQARVEADLAGNAGVLRGLARDGCPMLVVCGMYQLFGDAFVTVGGRRLPGLGILDVTTTGGADRMIGPVVLDTAYGRVVGYENHSGRTVLGAGQAPFGRVVHGRGNNADDGLEGAVTHRVHGTYLHGPILPANPAFADALIKDAVERGLGRPFDAEPIDDHLADQARQRQVARLLSGRDRGTRTSASAKGRRRRSQV